MNKYRAITLGVALINLLLILLFPPYDYPSPHSGVPHFDGFHLVFGEHPNRIMNTGFLAIELFTVIINAAIVWLLLGERARMRRRLDRQKLVLVGVALNLLLALLFPPFQNHYTASEALLPSFDGFYFVFGDNSERVVIAAMLWFEMLFILVNGAMLWLLFCQPGSRAASAAERAAQAQAQLRRKR